FMCLLERVRVICLCVELFINRISVFRFLLPFSTTLIYSLSLHDALPIYLLIKSPEVGRMVPADHPVNGQVFTKAPPTGPADIRVTFTRWNDQYLSCQPVPDQLLPSLTADIPSFWDFTVVPSIGGCRQLQRSTGLVGKKLYFVTHC